MKICSMLFCMMALAASCSSRSAATNDGSQQSDTPVATMNVAFDADSAYSYVRQQCEMGPRVPGTEPHARCAKWLQAMLNQWCDTVVTQHGQVTTFDEKKLNILNIVGTFNPSATDRILLLAHWDCRPWADNDPDPAMRRQPVMGANDAASGIAVLLELARQMSLRRPGVGVDLLMVDAEDWGTDNDEDSWALGTQYWAQTPHAPAYRANFAILLDMVGARGAQFGQEYFSMQYAAGVVDMVWQAAKQAGQNEYFVNKRQGAITDDHVMLNRLAGIPCIDIIDIRTGSESGFFDGWHTTHDTIDQIDPKTLHAVGAALATLIYNW